MSDPINPQLAQAARDFVTAARDAHSDDAAALAFNDFAIQVSLAINAGHHANGEAGQGVLKAALNDVFDLSHSELHGTPEWRFRLSVERRDAADTAAFMADPAGMSAQDLRTAIALPLPEVAEAGAGEGAEASGDRSFAHTMLDSGRYTLRVDHRGGRAVESVRVYDKAEAKAVTLEFAEAGVQVVGDVMENASLSHESDAHVVYALDDGTKVEMNPRDRSVRVTKDDAALGPDFARTDAAD